ncbi:hypothetical protein ACFV3R_01165 [Streptomyces sp. NPDC059740]|uniref:DUF2795 domain-containing protein n=1 Tax=Streptomyces sp. NPDC059740 TaxID=3346926 RepID=UPI0036541EA5
MGEEDAMAEESDKRGPLRDDREAQEVEGEMRAGRALRADEALEPEPEGEDQPRASLAPEGAVHGAAPPGMDAEDVELRSELARHLSRDVFPADRAGVRAGLAGNNAPDRLLALADRLPEGEYADLPAVLDALGIPRETRRT